MCCIGLGDVDQKSYIDIFLAVCLYAIYLYMFSTHKGKTEFLVKATCARCHMHTHVQLQMHLKNDSDINYWSLLNNNSSWIKYSDGVFQPCERIFSVGGNVVTYILEAWCCWQISLAQNQEDVRSLACSHYSFIVIWYLISYFFLISNQLIQYCTQQCPDEACCWAVPPRRH